MLGKSHWDFTRGKVKKGKNSPAFRSDQKSPDRISLGETGDKLKKGSVCHSESSGGTLPNI